MYVNNRLADVTELICHACQDFLKLVILPGWQQKLYEKAKENVEKEIYLDQYKPIYQKMRNVGIENYSVDDMDVTTISSIIRFCPEIAKTRNTTKNAIKVLTDNKNDRSHSNQNETPEELYSLGQIALVELKRFVECVDLNEKQIEDTKRLKYRQKYSEKIDSLRAVLDEERISLVQREKRIKQDIQKILESSDPLKEYHIISQSYYERTVSIEHKTIDEYIEEFIIPASDAGVEYAHYMAAYYYSQKRNYPEMTNKLRLMNHCLEKHGYDSDLSDVDNLINLTFDYVIKTGKHMTDDMTKMIDNIVDFVDTASNDSNQNQVMTCFAARCYILKGNYSKMESKLDQLILGGITRLNINRLLQVINDYVLVSGNPATEKMKKTIESIRRAGCAIKQEKNGCYYKDFEAMKHSQ